MGFGLLQANYQAHLMKYLDHRAHVFLEHFQWHATKDFKGLLAAIAQRTRGSSFGCGLNVRR